MDTHGSSTWVDTIIAIRHAKDKIHKISDATNDHCKNAHAASVAHGAKCKEELSESTRMQQNTEHVEKQKNKSVQIAELDI